jgi:hypothetical protein
MVAGLAAGMAALLGAHQSSPSGRLALPVSQLGSPSAGGPPGPPGHGGPAGGPVWRLHCPALAAAAGPGSAEPRTWPLVNSFTLANLVASTCFLLDPGSNPGTIALACGRVGSYYTYFPALCVLKKVIQVLILQWCCPGPGPGLGAVRTSEPTATAHHWSAAPLLLCPSDM